MKAISELNICKDPGPDSRKKQITGEPQFNPPFQNYTTKYRPEDYTLGLKGKLPNHNMALQITVAH